MNHRQAASKPQHLSQQPGLRVPGATYRLQFNSRFTFRDALGIVDYLYALGISDIYASPLFQAAPGSDHGYDVCNHSRLNPELGSEEDFEALVEVLHARGMGLLLDVVPNHMGIANDCNEWWTDVLENGPSSPYARYFDVEWHPIKPELENKVLLPILEDQYGRVLEAGKLQVEYDSGAFYLRYYDRRLPVEPSSYAQVLHAALEDLSRAAEQDDPAVLELQSILTALSYLPPPTGVDPGKMAERAREKEVIKRRIAALCDGNPQTSRAIAGAVGTINGVVGQRSSFDMLDGLINSQAYRLAFWRVAGEEINYRRFFDVNDLVAIRMELPEVFAATHSFALDLAASGKVNGLRIDHPDGLWNPTAYFERVQAGYAQRLAERAAGGADSRQASRAAVRVAEGAKARGNENEQAGIAAPAGQASDAPLPTIPYSGTPLLYVVVEKILSEEEPLPRAWAVAGTTGYDFLASVNGLFVDQANEKAFNRIYNRFVGPQRTWRDLTIETKMAVMRSALSGEINALAHQLERVAERNRHYRDFTLRGLTYALRDTIACLSIYRTYVNAPEGIVSERDVQFVEAAVQEAQRRDPGTDASTYRFIADTLLLRSFEDFAEEERDELAHFVMKFQQLAGPVMAKGVEDTAFYIYNRLASLNEVGSHPLQFGTSPADFHKQNAERRELWPHSLLATSTHDNKRSEDVRARIDVLSEFPEMWRTGLAQWNHTNAGLKKRIAGQFVPDRNEEYLLYQTLLGAWSVGEESTHRPGAGLRPSESFRDRIIAYLNKATKEAKIHTSWLNPNREYDRALGDFVSSVLKPGKRNRFLSDLSSLLERVAFYGQFSSLAQVLLKITSPGVPDIYQGNELWDLSLVDPDNRRAVDYERRRGLLAELQRRVALSEGDGEGRARAEVRTRAVDGNGKAPVERVVPAAGDGKHAAGDLRELARELLAHIQDGRIKLYLTYRALNFRRAHYDLFTYGDYRPLAAQGAEGDHVVAFARTLDEQCALVVVPRLVVSLTGDGMQPPIGAEVWGDTWLMLSEGLDVGSYRDVFTGAVLEVTEAGGRRGLPLAELCGEFPVALLARE